MNTTGKDYHAWFFAKKLTGVFFSLRQDCQGMETANVISVIHHVTPRSTR